MIDCNVPGHVHASSIRTCMSVYRHDINSATPEQAKSERKTFYIEYDITDPTIDNLATSPFVWVIPLVLSRAITV